mmetsp:Transcript_25427/g.69909  ORF Transcript_25427/g.69909 Transcript_25427/m.69909 type:complete len:209 (+) Transcript_25427:730-1356(+)
MYPSQTLVGLGDHDRQLVALQALPMLVCLQACLGGLGLEARHGLALQRVGNLEKLGAAVLRQACGRVAPRPVRVHLVPIVWASLDPVPALGARKSAAMCASRVVTLLEDERAHERLSVDSLECQSTRAARQAFVKPLLTTLQLKMQYCVGGFFLKPLLELQHVGSPLCRHARELCKAPKLLCALGQHCSIRLNRIQELAPHPVLLEKL